MGSAAMPMAAPNYVVSLGEMMMDHQSLLDHVIEQVPGRVRDRFRYRVRCDALRLGVELFVFDSRERTHKVRLTDGCTVPEEFLAWLTLLE